MLGMKTSADGSTFAGVERDMVANVTEPGDPVAGVIPTSPGGFSICLGPSLEATRTTLPRLPD
jgi:hypothetical protein